MARVLRALRCVLMRMPFPPVRPFVLKSPRVSGLVGLCGSINSLVRRAWLPPREAQSDVFILHLRRLLADEDVHMQDWG